RDYKRAFRPAEVPPDSSGLAEFGMGMKSAACWFSPKWSVRSKALGEYVERTVAFDIDHIVSGGIEDLNVVSQRAAGDRHYTEISLLEIGKFPQRKTIAKIKDHLSSIYRMFLRSGRVRLYFNGEPLEFEEPSILNAPREKGPRQPIIWRKDID